MAKHIGEEPRDEEPQNVPTPEISEPTNPQPSVITCPKAERMFDVDARTDKEILYNERYSERIREAEARGEKILEFSLDAHAKLPVSALFRDFEGALFSLGRGAMDAQIDADAVDELLEEQPDLVADIKRYVTLREKLDGMWEENIFQLWLARTEKFNYDEAVRLMNGQIKILDKYGIYEQVDRGGWEYERTSGKREFGIQRKILEVLCENESVTNWRRYGEESRGEEPQSVPTLETSRQQTDKNQSEITCPRAERMFDVKARSKKIYSDESQYNDRVGEAEGRGEKVIELSFHTQAKLPVSELFCNFEGALTILGRGAIFGQIRAEAVAGLLGEHPDVVADIKRYVTLGEELQGMWKHNGGQINLINDKPFLEPRITRTEIFDYDEAIRLMKEQIKILDKYGIYEQVNKEDHHQTSGRGEFGALRKIINGLRKNESVTNWWR